MKSFRQLPALLFMILAQMHANAATDTTGYGVKKGLAAPITVYLSFDDGPILESRFLDSVALADSVPVNVFLVGENVFTNSITENIFESYKKNPYIEIGNHSYSHANKKYKIFYSNPSIVVSDIILNEDTLGLSRKIARLPGRNVWRIHNKCRSDLADAATAADSLVKLGYTIIGWDLEWRYDSARASFFSAAQMLQQVATTKWTFSPAQVVILCHDTMLQDPFFRPELLVFINTIKKSSNMRLEHISKYYCQ